MFNFTTSHGNVNVTIPATVPWQSGPHPVINVGIKMSGGTDSTLLAYILALCKRDFRPEVNLVPITTVKSTKPYQEFYAKRAVAKITELTGVAFAPHLIQFANPANNIIKEQEDFITQIYDNNLVDCHFYGETLNPDPNDPSFVSIRTDHNWGTDRDVPASTVNTNYSTRPFRNVNKKAVCEIYEQLNILEELFPLTRSCEARQPPNSGPEWMDNHCQQCWFCNERLWGFGRYV